jgi:homocysteine S-methyltransferase
MINLFDPFLEKQGFVILDGALATELERKGANLNDSLWSAKVLIESPELIQQVHLSYFLAGADIATTASYQATFEGFEKRGISFQEASQLLNLSVQLACEARDAFWAVSENRKGRLRPLVAASIGPYGAYLADGSEYRGDYGLTIRELIDFHRPRINVLANAGADLLAFETVPCMEEGRALVELIAEFPGKMAWLSFSCRDEKSLNHGEAIERAVALVNDSPQIIAAGINCTPPQFVEDLLKRAAGVTTKPFIAYPNSGEGWDAKHKCWLPATGQVHWLSLARKWRQAGAKVIGGCCRTTPEDIRMLREKLYFRIET